MKVAGSGFFSEKFPRAKFSFTRIIDEISGGQSFRNEFSSPHRRAITAVRNFSLNLSQLFRRIVESFLFIRVISVRRISKLPSRRTNQRLLLKRTIFLRVGWTHEFASATVKLTLWQTFGFEKWPYTFRVILLQHITFCCIVQIIEKNLITIVNYNYYYIICIDTIFRHRKSNGLAFSKLRKINVATRTSDF